jgi:hypothetical protein
MFVLDHQALLPTLKTIGNDPVFPSGHHNDGPQEVYMNEKEFTLQVLISLASTGMDGAKALNMAKVYTQAAKQGGLLSGSTLRPPQR